MKNIFQRSNLQNYFLFTLKRNILVFINQNTNEKTLKLADFGLARQFSNTLSQTSSCVGTARYAAPEYEDSNPSNPYDYKVDIW